jgi:hypothetical protein
LNYSLDEKDEIEINFIELLQEHSSTEINSNENEVIIYPIIEVLDEIKWENIFIDYCDYNAFFCFVLANFELARKSLKCIDCMQKQRHEKFYSGIAQELSNLRAKLAGQQSQQLSCVAFEFYLKLEYLYQQLRESLDPYIFQFAEIFLESATLLIYPEAHCDEIVNCILTSFVKDRIHSDLICRLPHQANKHASKSLN